MSKRISNFQIKDPIKNLEEDETMKNFVGMFPANHMNTFISFKPTILEKTAKYPFLIENTDSSDKGSAHW